MSQEKNDRTVFITGSTGYIGTRLIKQLIRKGYKVIALVRKGSEQKVPEGASIITADPFDSRTFQQHIPAGCVFIQLLGVSHPSPRKAKQFAEVDLRSVKASADAASRAGVSHFIYLSVAMAPSKLMYAYQQVRREGEEYCLAKELNCTFIRPWYVLGPGHWWPIILLPFYGLAELVPSLRKAARSKALVTIRQMLNTLIAVFEEEPIPLRIYEINDIRSGRSRSIHTISKKSVQLRTAQ